MEGGGDGDITFICVIMKEKNLIWLIWKEQELKQMNAGTPDMDK